MAVSTAATCVLPRDEYRPVPLPTIAHELSVAIDRTRYRDTSPAGAIEEFFSTYGIRLPAGNTASSVSDAIFEHIFADEVYDSEQQQAERAAAKVLYKLFDASTVEITGWLRGQHVIDNYRRFVLTGDLCEKCETNPSCYGESGSGIRCLDVAGCGWSFCF